MGNPQEPTWRSFVIHSTCAGRRAPWVVLYFQTLLQGARARPQRPHIAATRCRAVSLARHQVVNAHAATATPNCATPLWSATNGVSNCFRTADAILDIKSCTNLETSVFARVGETSALSVALAIPSNPIDQAHPTRPANDCVSRCTAWGCATRCDLRRSIWQPTIKGEARDLRAISWCDGKPGESNDCAVQSGGLGPCWLTAGISPIDGMLTRPCDTTSTRREGRAYEDH